MFILLKYRLWVFKEVQQSIIIGSRLDSLWFLIIYFVHWPRCINWDSTRFNWLGFRKGIIHRPLLNASLSHNRWQISFVWSSINTVEKLLIGLLSSSRHGCMPSWIILVFKRHRHYYVLFINRNNLRVQI